MIYFIADTHFSEDNIRLYENRPFGSAAEMLMYGKEASNRKQEINRQHHTIPNQRPKDKHYGNVHSQLYTFPRMPTMALL
ncbi:MAG: hypothetical protein OSJ73_23470 [Lachnospiraceae bacterium]|nr:hypothetical protein [Lachnospiraceae bacterium]